MVAQQEKLLCLRRAVRRRQMAEQQLRGIQGQEIPEEKVQDFIARIRGEVIRPGDPQYETARRIWNASIDRHPGLIVRCLGTADVIASVDFARENNVLVAVRGGGHNVAGRALCDDGLVIDLSLMKGVFVDPASQTVLVQGGATLGDVDSETHVHGLSVPIGVVSKTGIAGLALGGGAGWLVRRYGFACDNIISAQIVTADGKLQTASAEENADLFWALRGGGGNFGVVTSFLFHAYPVSTVLGGLIAWPRAAAPEVIRFYRDFMESAPNEFTAYAALAYAPDGTTPIVAVIGCYSGDLTEGERVVEPLRRFGTPALDAFQPIPMPVLQSMLDAGNVEGNYNYWKSTFLRELSDEAIDKIIEFGNANNSPLTATIIEWYGGAGSHAPASGTAFAQRGDIYLNIMPQWTDGTASDTHIAWARSFYDAMQPFSSGGFQLNFLDQEADDTVRAAFGQNYSRLVEAKRKYDPQNLFRLNQNIKP
jgi:FAD/FMN-containing dehydrogenase